LNAQADISALPALINIVTIVASLSQSSNHVIV
jgi:hypothetical protein